VPDGKRVVVVVPLGNGVKTLVVVAWTQFVVVVVPERAGVTVVVTVLVCIVKVTIGLPGEV
jgi:hypothetical protein